MGLPRPTTSENLLGGVTALVDALERSRLFPNAHGLITVTWPGGAAASNVVSAAHGLGVVPTTVLATLNDSAGSGACMVCAFRDATSVSIQLVTAGFTPGGTITNPVSWLAIA